MRRWAIAGLAMFTMMWGAVGTAAAQTNLIGGGLTALPPMRLGSNVVQNGDFELVTSGTPTGWRVASGWAADQLVAHSGTFSYRRTGGAGMTSQALQLKKGLHNFSVWVKTEGLGTGLRIEIDFRPAVNEWMVTDIASGTADWKLYEVKNIAVPQDRAVTIKLYTFGGTGAGTAWFDQAAMQEQLAQPVEAYLLHPNYRGMLFDDQPQTMKFDITVAPPGGDFAKHQVKGTLKDEASGQVVATQTYAAAANFVADLDGSDMQPGRAYLASFSLVDLANGASVYTYPAYRVSKTPAAARQSMNVTFDDKNRILIKGEPRFVLGIYDSGGGYSSAESYFEDRLFSPTGARRMEGLRVNFYLNYWLGETPAEPIKALMNVLQRRDIMYLQTGNCFDHWQAGTNFLMHGSDAYVQDIGTHPGLAGYYTADECKSELMPGIFDQYVRLRQLDPDSITFAALFGHSDLIVWRDAADVLSTDPYPLFSSEPAGGYNHKQVADWTRWTRDVVKGARPIMTVLQFFKFTSQGRWPTLAEMRNHAYMAIVEGANGLWWWSEGNGLGALASPASCTPAGSWCQEQLNLFNNLKTVVGEVADLEPALLADDAPGALTGNSNPTAIRTKVKVHGGKGYVFAYNYTNQSVTATLTWNTAPGGITVNAENRTVAASGNSFTDAFGPYQAHVYVVSNGGNGGTPPPPPPPPTSLTVSFTNPQNGAELSDSKTVSVSVAGGAAPYTYTVKMDTAQVFSGANNTFTLNTKDFANGAHTLTATVTDSSNPTKNGTATINVTVTNTAPPPPPPPPPPPTGALSVAMTSPKANATVKGSVAVNIWVEKASGTSNTFTLTVDDTEVAKQTCNCAHVWPGWDTTKVADGQHKLTAKVTDAAGNTGQTTLTVTTANGVITPPPPPPPPPVPPLTLAFTAPNGATVSGTTTVAVQASGGSGNGYTYRLTVNGTTVNTNSHSWNTSTVANGSYTLTAEVTDSANKKATASRTVTVSNTAPPPPPAGLVVALTSPKGNATVKGTVAVNIWVEKASGTSNTFILMVDDKEVARQTCNCAHVWPGWNTAGYANGIHRLKAIVTDATGKRGEVSLTVTVQN